MIADDDEVPRLGACGAAHVVTKGEFAAAIAEPVDGRASLRRPRGDRRAALHQRDDVGAEGRGAAAPASGVVHHLDRRVPRLRADEAQLICVPPYHIAGIAAVLSSFYAGRRIMYLPTFDADGVGRAWRARSASPTPWWCRRCWGGSSSRRGRRGDRAPALRHLSYGGGRMPLELVERTLRDMPHVDLVNAYGLTETSSTIAMLTPDDHREAFASDDPAVRARLGRSGARCRPSRWRSATSTRRLVAGGREGRDLGAGRAGGRASTSGTTRSTDDGWFRTRDAGWFDERRLPLRRRPARRRDRAGRREHLARRDRRGAHGARRRRRGRGDRHPRRRVGRGGGGRRGPAPGGSASEAELQGWVRERLRSTKMPGVIEFRDELPYSPTGKLLRRVLRDELAQGVEEVS